MTKYAVKLRFIYSDIVHVEADNRADAEELTLEHCQEEYEYYYSCDIEEE